MVNDQDPTRQSVASIFTPGHERGNQQAGGHEPSVGARHRPHGTPGELGQWWADALSRAVVWQSEDEYSIRPAPDQRPGLTFVTMRDAKVTKNRLHLDFHPDSQTA